MTAPIQSPIPRPRPDGLTGPDTADRTGLDAPDRLDVQEAVDAVAGAEVDALVTQEGLDVSEATSHSVSEYDFRSLLAQGGWTRSQARTLQTGLNERGFDAGTVDGIVGSNTRAAIERAEAAYEGQPLVSDDRFSGLMGQTEWTRAEGRELQTGLNERGFEAGAVDGIVGNNTRAAMDRAREAGAVEAGAVEPAAVAVEGTPTDAAVSPDRDIPEPRFQELLAQQTWTRPEARDLQTGLNERGFDVGPVDGIVGTNTRAGIEAARTARDEAAAAATAVTEEDQVRVDDAAAALGSHVIQPEAGEEGPEVAPFQPEPVEGPDGQTISPERQRELIAREPDAWQSAPGAEVEELQTVLAARGYEVGSIDGDYGPTTRDAHELARRRQRLLDGYSGADSGTADLARTASPLPTNMDNLILSNLGLDTAITNDSLTDGQQMVVYETALRAMERTGEDVGGTTYADYGRAEFHEYFNRGNVTGEAIMSSFTDDEFTVASTVGRFTYMQDPEDPDRIFAFDGYDWNPEERNFTISEDDSDASELYKTVRNNMRDGQREEGLPDRDNRVFLVFSRSEMEARRAGLQGGEAPVETAPAELPTPERMHPHAALDAVGSVIHSESPGAQDALVDAMGGEEGVTQALDGLVQNSRLPNTTRWAADLAAQELTTAEPEDRPVDPQVIEENLRTLRQAAGMYVFSDRRQVREPKEAINEVLVNATPAELQAMLEADPRIGEDLVRTFRMTDMAYAQMVGGYFGDEDMVSYWVNDTPDVRRGDYAEIMNPQ